MTPDQLRDRIRPAIRAIGLRETSRLSGVPFASIAHWLRGIRPMSADRTRAIVKALRTYHRQQAERLGRIEQSITTESRRTRKQ